MLFWNVIIFTVLAKWIGIWRDYDYDDYHNDGGDDDDDDDVGDDDDDNSKMEVQGNSEPENKYTTLEELDEPQINDDDKHHSNDKGQG